MRPGGRWVDAGSFGSLGRALGGRWVHAGRSVHPRSLGSLVRAMVVVEFIQGGWVHHGAPWGSLVSFGSVWFTREHPGGVGFMRVVGLIRGRWVHSGAPWGSLGSSGVVGFMQVRPWV